MVALVGSISSHALCDAVCLGEAAGEGATHVAEGIDARDVAVCVGVRETAAPTEAAPRGAVGSIKLQGHRVVPRFPIVR